MELKRFINIALVIILALMLVVPASADSTEALTLGRIGVSMPDITVEIKGTGYNPQDITATLDKETLTVAGSADYNNASATTRVYLLVDLSVSMDSSFPLVKKNMTTLIESLGANDKVVLITFGKSSVDVVLDGSEDRATALSTVKSLKCNQAGTMFYEALNKAYQLSGTSTERFDREYAVVFSDGIDEQNGNSTFDEMLRQYDSRALPLYAACSYDSSNSASKTATDRFGELARASGGSIQIIKNEKNFKDFMTEINNVTILKLKAQSNHADGKEKLLSVKVGNSQVECNVPITRSTDDNIAPTVKSAVYDINKDAFVISFSEKVTGADNPASYKITDAKGTALEISDIFYSEQTDTYEIKTKSAVHKGTYTVEFSGIKDNSKQANQLSGKHPITVDKAKARGLAPWIIIVIIVTVVMLSGGVVLLIVLLSVKKNKTENSSDSVNTSVIPQGASAQQVIDYQAGAQDVVKHHIKANETARIKLRIKTGNTSEQNIETNLVSSLIIGRSDTCDIYIDDTKLSRQHFVLEHDNGVFYVMDLQSRNGTMLNGIRINSRQKINSGDRILAGLSDIIITIIR